MASAPNMRVAPSAAPAGTTAPAVADPLEFISRILAAQPELGPVLAPVSDGAGETPSPQGAAAEARPNAGGDAVAADPTLDALIPLVQAQGDYTVAVTVKSDSAENADQAEAPETDGQAQAAPLPVANTPAPVPVIQPVAAQTVVTEVQADVVATARPSATFAASRGVSVKKQVMAKAPEKAGDGEAGKAKPDAAPELIPSPVPTKAAQAPVGIGKPAPAPTRRAATSDTPTPQAPTLAPNTPTPAPADTTTPDDASAQIATALRSAVPVPDAGVRSTTGRRTELQAAARISTAEPTPQPQQARASEPVLPEAQPTRPAANQDGATPAQPTTPWSPATAAPARPVEQAAGRIEAADRAIDRALDMARDGEWLDQLARDISSSGDRDCTLRFRLNPQSLGQLRVELSQSEHGTNVRMSVDTEAARTLLTDAQSRLVAEARAQGVRIAETHVDLSGSDQHMSGDPRRQDEARQNPMIRTATTSSEREAPARPKASRSDRYA